MHPDASSLAEVEVLRVDLTIDEKLGILSTESFDELGVRPDACVVVEAARWRGFAPGGTSGDEPTVCAVEPDPALGADERKEAGGREMRTTVAVGTFEV